MAQIINQTPAYHLSGKIVYGQGIGKLVGTPTANLQILSRDEMPPVGVYVTEVLLEGQLYYGVTNIGTRSEWTASRPRNFSGSKQSPPGCI